MVKIPLKIPGYGSGSGSGPKSNGLLLVRHPTLQKHFVKICGQFFELSAKLLNCPDSSVVKILLKVPESAHDPPPNSNQLLPLLRKKNWSQFVYSFLSRPADRQADRQIDNNKIIIYVAAVESNTTSTWISMSIILQTHNYVTNRI